MKRYILLITTIFALFTACKKDDDNGGTSDNDRLIGKWEVLREMGKDNAYSEWRIIESYEKPNKYIWVFTKTEYGMYGENWGADWEENMSIYKLNFEKMEIFLQLAFPKLKVYKLTETEFEVEQPTASYYEYKLIMRRIE